jgi:hypothetical protein
MFSRTCRGMVELGVSVNLLPQDFTRQRSAIWRPCQELFTEPDASSTVLVPKYAW